MARKKLKIVGIGFGHSFGRGTLADFLGRPEFKEFDLEIALVDIDAQAAERMLKLAQLLKDYYKSDAKLSATTNREEALPGANYVMISVEVERFRLWNQDVQIGKDYGFKQINAENGGPGAVFHTLRSLHNIIPIARDVERLCPDALVLNYSNPVPRVTMGLTQLTKTRHLGLCHGSMTATKGAAEVLGCSHEDLDVVTAGMNHFFSFLKIADKKTGKDLYPKLMDRVLNDPDCPKAPPLCKFIAKNFHVYTYPVDSHPGEYLQWANDVADKRQGMAWSDKPLDFSRFFKSPLDAYISGEKPMDEEGAKLSEELGIPIILGLELDLKNRIYAINTRNTGLYIDNLPEWGIVEVPASVDAKGVHPEKVGSIPDALASFTYTQFFISRMVAQAYQERSKNLLYQALLMDPIVDSTVRAKEFMETMLHLQRNYLPEFV